MTAIQTVNRWSGIDHACMWEYSECWAPGGTGESYGECLRFALQGSSTQNVHAMYAANGGIPHDPYTETVSYDF